jgi:capsular polysaccharide biosynthesis protein
MTKPLIDPKELTPAAIGFAVGLAMIVFFVLLSMAMNQTLLVDHSNIPYQ